MADETLKGHWPWRLTRAHNVSRKYSRLTHLIARLRSMRKRGLRDSHRIAYLPGLGVQRGYVGKPYARKDDLHGLNDIGR